MDHPAVFAATLGLSHTWQIVSLSMEQETSRMDIGIDFVGDCTATCPVCNAQGNFRGSQKETWYHEDFFNYKTFLHVRAPRLLCPCCGISLVERPWSRAGSRFSLIDCDRV
ncbi:transposase family protein [bacterium]|nr:transposase family protein [bacterium]